MITKQITIGSVDGDVEGAYTCNAFLVVGKTPDKDAFCCGMGTPMDVMMLINYLAANLEEVLTEQ